VRVFVEDPEFASGLDPEALAAAEQITAPVLRVPQGAWDFKADPSKLESHLGLLIVEGLLLREVVVGDVAVRVHAAVEAHLRPRPPGDRLQLRHAPEAHDLRPEAVRHLEVAHVEDDVIDPAGRLGLRGDGRGPDLGLRHDVPPVGS